MAASSVVSTTKTKQNLSDPLGLFSLLSPDLVLEILYGLPVKSLLTLKCVSKPLNSLISDPKFSKDHLRLSQTRHNNLLVCPYFNFKDLEFVFDSRLPSIFNNFTSTISETKLYFPIDNCYNVSLVDSCDGIICFKTTDYYNRHVRLVIWNPCTRNFKVLSLYENPPSLTSKTSYSFGYDHFTNSYRVVVVFCYQLNKSCKTLVKVSTLGNDFWRTIPDFPSQIMGQPERHPGKFVSGTINWVILDRENDSSRVILSLDLGNESYQEILQPNYGLDEPLHNFSLGVYRDYLCVLAHTKSFLDIWVMKDFGNKESWTKLFIVPFAEFLDYYGYSRLGYTRLLYISEEDDQVVLDFYNKIYVYNYKNRISKIPEIHGFTRFTSNVYAESLISP
ncbi:putative F-box domain-containing protein [Medicago truncatula]|uniref:F-box protein interaction domain protein n=1 Tax=Medicago truncatula TaxID=3880 RepID=A0A072UGE2_MEDTR|nr:F-box/kelch-repeat protein At3g23880-like [Medicago truncatula]KEH24840.1 F-box protein interaction domain protein [Medicago truncatula]RHN49825.1 putative F-box domain-containing protein [Medicago truncatula]